MKCQNPVLLPDGSMGRCHKCTSCVAASGMRDDDLMRLRLDASGEKLPSCERPTVIDGHIVTCRECDACQRNRMTMLLGRAYAEGLASSSFVALTLTYNETRHGAASWLDYRDVQLMLKRLRRDGYSVRYIVAGEYGSRRGRAHWHVVLFFQGDMPELPPEETECVHWRYWVHFRPGSRDAVPLGYVYVQKPDYYGLMYVLKYATKDDGSEKSTRRVMMSKRPALGAAYWPELARSRISAGVAFGREYTLPGARFANGNPVRFFLQGSSLRDAFFAHVRAWREDRGRRSSLPPVRHEDKAALVRALLPGDFDVRASHPDIGSWPDGLERLRWRMSQGFELFKLPNGFYVWQTVRSGERGEIWLVEKMRDLIAMRRGRWNTGPRSLGIGDKPPF